MKFGILAAILFSLVGATAHAQGSGGVGNGGDAVLVGSRYYLLDLAEAGIHQTLSTQLQKMRSDYAKLVGENGTNWLTRDLSSYGGRWMSTLPFDERLKSDILMITNYMYPQDALLLIAGLRAYTWRFVPGPLVNIDGERTSLNLPLYQAAVRRDYSILIDQDIFAGMDDANRLALVFHEILYALMKPSKSVKGYEFQESWTLREFVGEYFVEKFKNGWGFDHGVDFYDFKNSNGIRLIEYLDKPFYGLFQNVKSAVNNDNRKSVAIQYSARIGNGSLGSYFFYKSPTDNTYENLKLVWANSSDLKSVPLVMQDLGNRIHQACLKWIHAGKTQISLYSYSERNYIQFKTMKTEQGSTMRLEVVTLPQYAENQKNGCPSDWCLARSRTANFLSQNECVKNVAASLGAMAFDVFSPAYELSDHYPFGGL